MKSKLSFRKKIIMQKINPTLLIILLGITNMLGNDNRITSIISALVAILFIVVIIYSNGKNSEPEDEMAKHNILKAGNLSFTITIVSVGLVLCYGFLMGISTVIFSLPTICFIFAGMNILNLIIFLVYDIRGY